MILQLVQRALIKRIPEPEKLYEFVTREIYPALISLRELFNALMELINNGTFPLGGKLSNQGIRFVVTADGILTIGNDDDAVGNLHTIDISDTHKILFGPVWMLTGTEHPDDDPICAGAPSGSIYMRHYQSGEPLVSLYVRTPAIPEWTVIA